MVIMPYLRSSVQNSQRSRAFLNPSDVIAVRRSHIHQRQLEPPQSDEPARGFTVTL
jgi:hypothetical protein